MLGVLVGFVQYSSERATCISRPYYGHYKDTKCADYICPYCGAQQQLPISDKDNKKYAYCCHVNCNRCFYYKR